VCKDAILILLDYGRKKWKTCQAVLDNRLAEHGNKGRLCGPGKSFASEVKTDLHEYFHQMQQFASPKTTRFVREETGTGLRDGKENLLELPTCWSKRAMYGRFCFVRGCVVSCTHNGNTKTTPRTDEQWEAGNEKRICSWRSFLTVWDINYPLVQIKSASADICTDCPIFFNRMKYTTANEATAEEDDHPNTTSREEIINPYLDPNANDEQNADTPVDLQQENTRIELVLRESILLKAALHVQQAMVQRKLANNKIQQAMDTADLPHLERHYCFIADYSQNMELPFGGESQPGDSYYFSALKINVFGIVDCSIFGSKLSAHVYHEGVGKKGGNNVASLLVNEFQRIGIMRQECTGKELTIIMDNCAGQNKNRMVLRLANYLVEADFFEKVNFIFYVVGHTKNDCDRWFNSLKKNYRRRNIYTFDYLVESMNTNHNITVTVTKESNFKNWDKFYDSIYKRFVPGSTHKTQIFSACKENKTTLCFRTDDLPETQATTQELLKKGAAITPERAAMLKSPPLEWIEAPGIPPIKQVKSFSKYLCRTFVLYMYNILISLIAVLLGQVLWWTSPRHVGCHFA
jgi:hypothetical protein